MTLFHIKAEPFEGGLRSQPRVVVESHMAKKFALWMSRVLAMKVMSADNCLDPQNSSLGIVCTLIGATLVFDISSTIVTLLSL